jgi:DNA-binding MarR family transcriptional regulator
MTDLNKLLSPIFLREKELRKLTELLYFSYRDLFVGTDEILQKINFNRVHYRIIYFIGENKEITIQDLIKVLKITKQNLSHLLNELVKKEYIKMQTGKDKRTKKLQLTKKGDELEKKLSIVQINKLKNLLHNFEESEINGFKKILFSMIDAQGKKILIK